MKTAKEMYQWCTKKGYSSGFSKGNAIKHFTLIENALSQSETVRFAFIGIHDYTSISKHDGDFAYAVTDNRIIFAQKRFIGESIQIIALNNLNGITMNNKALTGVITFDTMKEQFNVMVGKGHATNIFSELNNIIFTPVN